MTEKTTAPVGTPDPFDPATLRLGQDFAATVGVKKLLTRVPVGKPGRQVFFRVHPDPDWHLATMILELKEDREVYLVAPDLYAELLGEIVPVMLYPTITARASSACGRAGCPARMARPIPGTSRLWRRPNTPPSGGYGLPPTRSWVPTRFSRPLAICRNPSGRTLASTSCSRSPSRTPTSTGLDHPVVKRLRGAI